MKFFVFFFLCCVALAAAAPQLIWPGFVSPIGASETVVAGPTVVNGIGHRPIFAPWYPGLY